MKPETNQPLARYGIDRTQLINHSLNLKDIDRIYNALFVYSIGFYEMLSTTILSHTSQKYSIIGKIWKVFALLLEFCCKSGY